MGVSSLKKMLKELKISLKRFPFAFLSVMFFSVSGILTVEYGNEIRDFSQRLLYISILAFPVFISISLIFEKSNIFAKIASNITVLGLLSFYFFEVSANLDDNLIELIRYFLFLIAAHLLVSFSPFVFRRTNMLIFWDFNRSLLFSLIISLFYSMVLYAGVSIALLAIDNLFSVKLNNNLFAHVGFIMIGIVNGCFFLSHIPKIIVENDKEIIFPRMIKIFVQFVLLPLATLYFLILYIYAIKIVVTWELPKGWIVYLVNGLSTFGIFSLLLLYPIRNLKKNQWIRIYSNFFYLALFPLLVLLFVSIYKRIEQYGITENRYFVLLIAFWMAFISILSLINKNKNILILPVSLFIFVVLSSFGYWGAFSTSSNSQKKRLKSLLEKHKILVNNQIDTSLQIINFEDYTQIHSKIRYLTQRGEQKQIKEWCKNIPEDVFDDNYTNRSLIQKNTDAIIKYMNIKEDKKQIKENVFFDFKCSVCNKILLNTTDFDYILDYETDYDNEHDEYLAGDSKFELKVVENSKIIFLFNQLPLGEFTFNQVIERLNKVKNLQKNKPSEDYNSLTQKYLNLFFENDQVKLKIIIKEFRGYKKEEKTDKYTYRRIHFICLLKNKVDEK